MKSALSTQKRHTFFLRTKLRLPRLAGPPGPPGPLGRPPGPPPGPDGRPPPNDDPPLCPPPCDCCPPCSSAIRYLLIKLLGLNRPIRFSGRSSRQASAVASRFRPKAERAPARC